MLIKFLKFSKKEHSSSFLKRDFNIYNIGTQFFLTFPLSHGGREVNS